MTVALEKAADAIVEYSRNLTATSALMLAILGGFIGDQPERTAAVGILLPICWITGGLAVFAGLAVQGRFISILGKLETPQSKVLLRAIDDPALRGVAIFQAFMFIATLILVPIILGGVAPAEEEPPEPTTTINIVASSTTSTVHQSWPTPDEIK
ncbi:hypothetical protein GCM10009422_08170 [Brevundimonas kwangchunensis]|uniref:Uncharacterized protein n=1 Tax=Brevundimonas kwangchunensis TaxID=322163 RepID=A0ABN1GP12_9CAUL